MGAPTSGLLAEFFLQNLENAHIPTLTKKHKITGYFRYVDDILIIYDSNHSNILDILHDFNKIHPNLTFTAEQEKDQKLNFLDITIHKTPNKWDFSIHRKPTFTDTIIPYDSNHPHQHKYATTRFLYNRLHTYNIQGYHKKTETSTITNILQNNGFPTQPPHKKPRKEIAVKPTNTPTPTPKWATFTYTGKETYLITKLFNNTNIKIGFKTNNSILTTLARKKQYTDINSKSGIYKLTCPDCGKAYVGQTGRDFITRFKEHRHAFRTANQSYSFAKHLTENLHHFGCMEETMEILHLQNKGKHLNTLEKYYIYAEHKKHNHLNDDSTIFPNKIFDTIINQTRPLRTPSDHP
jgi:hypothetical protein